MIWLIVLIGGVMAVGMVFRVSSQGGTGNGAGFFDYQFQSRIFPSVEGDPSIFYIELEGRAPKRFKLYGGVSPVYDRISMNWELHSDYEGRPEGHVIFHFDSNTVSDRGASAPLNVESMLAIMEIPDRPANRLTLQYLLDILESYHSGRLPRPSHHHYTLEDPMSGNLKHVARGYIVRYPILSWVGIWILTIPVFYSIRRMTSCKL